MGHDWREYCSAPCWWSVRPAAVTTTAVEKPPTRAEAMRKASTIQVSDTSLGDVLTDGDGKTLYMFDKDTQGTSVCEGDCLVAWPALEGEPDAGDGAQADLIGTIERSDGTTQATYAGHPLYDFVQDAEPGDVNGQGVEDVWWVLDAAGAPVSDARHRRADGGGVRLGR